MLIRGVDGEVACLEAGFQFPDAPVFHGKQLKKLNSWILHTGNWLGTQPTIYANLAAEGRYVFNPFAGDDFDRVRHFVNEETEALDYADMNTFLESLKMAYDNSDWVHTQQ